VKRGSFVVAMFLSLLLFLAGVAPAAGEKSVAAKVNGVEITSEAVATMMGSLLAANVGGAPGSAKSMEETRKEALDQLILLELAYQKAKSEGWTVDPKVLDNAVANLRRAPEGDGKYREFTEKNPVPEEELRKRIERNLTLRRVLARELRNKVSVSEEETRKEYETAKESYARPEKTVVVDVVFFLDPGDADSRKKAEEMRKRIGDDKEKNPWSLVADGSFVVRDMEVDGNREKELYEAAKNLKVGELSGVFAAAGTLHVVKLKEYSPRQQFTFEEVMGRIEMDLRSRAMRKRMEEWGVELKKGAKIEIMETAGRP
jgi:peptidyl-prolyl cis-trans isomerase C